MGANGDAFLIKMRQGECEPPGSEGPSPNFVPLGKQMQILDPAVAAREITATLSHHDGNSF